MTLQGLIPSPSTWHPKMPQVRQLARFVLLDNLDHNLEKAGKLGALVCIRELTTE
jgi:hypothetical protein